MKIENLEEKWTYQKLSVSIVLSKSIKRHSD